MTKTWGPCTWILFHTLAEKLNDQHDNIENITMLIKLIKYICSNLPCPDCQQHAIQQLGSLKEHMIKNKSDLKNVLNSFHNIVNRRLNKPIITMDECDKKYNLAKTEAVVGYFFQIWSRKSHNPKMMTEELHKERLVTWFRKWWNDKHMLFNV